MKCLFVALEGFTAEVLARSLAAGALPSLAASSGRALVTSHLTFPLSFARVAMKVTAMTGTWPDQHGILLAQKRESNSGSFQTVTAAERARPAIWELLDRQGVDGVSVGWPLPHAVETVRTALVGAEFGFTPSAEFQPKLAQCVYPAALRESLGHCWMRPDELDPVLIGSLAPGWKQVDQSVDRRLSLLAGVIAGNVSLHAAFLELLDSHPWEFATVLLTLPGELASLERASVPMGDEVFAGLFDRALPLLEAFLAQILRRVPPDTSVVIAGLPHNEQPHLPGFVALSGAAIDPAATRPIVSVLDLAALVGRLVGLEFADLPGRRLLSAVRPGLALRTASSAGLARSDRSPTDYASLLAVPAPIRYLPGQPIPAEQLWHYHALRIVSGSLRARREMGEALPFLTALAELAPTDRSALLALSACQAELGQVDAALDTAYAAASPLLGREPSAAFRVMELELRASRPAIARNLLATVESPGRGPVSLQAEYANVLILLRDWPAATALLERLLRDYPDDAHVHRMYARCQITVGRWQKAFDHAMTSLRWDDAQPRTHEILGHALVGMGADSLAWQAFETAATLAPKWPRPRAKLARLAQRMGKPKEEVDGLVARYWQTKRAADYPIVS